MLASGRGARMRLEVELEGGKAGLYRVSRISGLLRAATRLTDSSCRV